MEIVCGEQRNCACGRRRRSGWPGDDRSLSFGRRLGGYPAVPTAAAAPNGRDPSGGGPDRPDGVRGAPRQDSGRHPYRLRRPVRETRPDGGLARGGSDSREPGDADAIEPNNPDLRHVALLQGAKAYGVHLGQIPVPARESPPRHIHPNFHWEQQDFLAARQAGKDWSWTVFRPQVVFGFAYPSMMNMLAAIGAYAAISRQLGLPLIYPWKRHARVTEATDARLLARAIAWSGQTPAASNQIFNVTNGDVFVWENVWPVIARAFSMPLGLPHPMPLARIMPGHAGTWRTIVERYGLEPVTLGCLGQRLLAIRRFRLLPHPFDLVASQHDQDPPSGILTIASTPRNRSRGGSPICRSVESCRRPPAEGGGAWSAAAIDDALRCEPPAGRLRPHCRTAQEPRRCPPRGFAAETMRDRSAGVRDSPARGSQSL